MSDVDSSAAVSEGDQTGLPGIVLTFAELAVLPLLTGQQSPSPFLLSIGLDRVEPASDLERAGLASLTVRGLLEVSDEGPLGPPPLVALAELVGRADRCVIVEIGRAGSSGSFEVLELGGMAAVHRQIAPLMHRFTPLSESSNAVSLCERIAEDLRDEPGSTMRLRPTVIDGAAIDAPMSLVDLERPIRPQVETLAGVSGT